MKKGSIIYFNELFFFYFHLQLQMFKMAAILLIAHIDALYKVVDGLLAHVSIDHANDSFYLCLQLN